MTKKKIGIILIIIGLVIAISAGVFYWYINREIKGSPDDYVIRETNNGIIVENKKAGLTVKAPEGWEVKKLEFLEGSALIYTEDIEGRMEHGIVEPPLTKGCGVETAVVYKKMTFEEIKEEVKAIHWGLHIKSEEFEEITLNQHPALKNIFDSEILGQVMVIYIPIKNKLYNFSLNWAPNEKEQCIQEFDRFLETVVID
jgi:hypothetical protein